MKIEPNYFYKTTKTPLGKLKLIATDKGLAAILWENDPPRRVRLDPLVESEAHPVLLAAERELTEYFDGKRTSFSVPLDAAGTEFQTRVWRALSEIPFGETRSYLDIAKRVGNAKAVRAVGAANGKNPISIIVPCHRVIGTSGKLVGFAGGLGTKAHLLKLEADRMFHATTQRPQRGRRAKAIVHRRPPPPSAAEGRSSPNPLRCGRSVVA